jgi:hypothetical protein
MDNLPENNTSTLASVLEKVVDVLLSHLEHPPVWPGVFGSGGIAAGDGGAAEFVTRRSIEELLQLQQNLKAQSLLTPSIGKQSPYALLPRDSLALRSESASAADGLKEAIDDHNELFDAYFGAMFRRDVYGRTGGTGLDLPLVASAGSGQETTPLVEQLVAPSLTDAAASGAVNLLSDLIARPSTDGDQTLAPLLYVPSVGAVNLANLLDATQRADQGSLDAAMDRGSGGLGGGEVGPQAELGLVDETPDVIRLAAVLGSGQGPSPDMVPIAAPSALQVPATGILNPVQSGQAATETGDAVSRPDLSSPTLLEAASPPQGQPTVQPATPPPGSSASGSSKTHLVWTRTADGKYTFIQQPDTPAAAAPNAWKPSAAAPPIGQVPGDADAEPALSVPEKSSSRPLTAQELRDKAARLEAEGNTKLAEEFRQAARRAEGEYPPAMAPNGEPLLGSSLSTPGAPAAAKPPPQQGDAWLDIMGVMRQSGGGQFGRYQHDVYDRYGPEEAKRVENEGYDPRLDPQRESDSFLMQGIFWGAMGGFAEAAEVPGAIGAGVFGRELPWASGEALSEGIAAPDARALAGAAEGSRAAASQAGPATSAELQPYGGPGGGHHVPAKSAFTGAEGYSPNEALAIPNSELTRLGVRHNLVSAAQQSLYREFAQTGKTLTWEVVQDIETQALVQGGMNPEQAAATAQKAIQSLKNSGIAGPTRIPWGG